MSLLCSLITKDKSLVICFCSNNLDEDYEKIIDMILPYLKTNKNGRIAITNKGYTAYYCDYNMLTFICLCNSHLSSSTAFGFLNKIQDDFLQMFPDEIMKSFQYFKNCLNESFEIHLSDQMTIFNTIGFQPIDSVEELKLGLMNTWNSCIDPIGKYQEDEQTKPITVSDRTMISNTDKISETHSETYCCGTKERKCFMISIICVIIIVGLLVLVYFYYFN